MDSVFSVVLGFSSGREKIKSLNHRGHRVSQGESTEEMLICSSLFHPGTDLFMDRVAMLNEILTQNPNDAFARYGLAMEYSNRGDVETAMAEFGKLLAAHSDYTAGYFMAAQTLAKASRVDEAKKMLADGIASAQRTGNGHALSEMEGMLTELG